MDLSLDLVAQLPEQVRLASGVRSDEVAGAFLVGERLLQAVVQSGGALLFGVEFGLEAFAGERLRLEDFDLGGDGLEVVEGDLATVLAQLLDLDRRVTA